MGTKGDNGEDDRDSHDAGNGEDSKEHEGGTPYDEENRQETKTTTTTTRDDRSGTDVPRTEHHPG